MPDLPQDPLNVALARLHRALERGRTEAYCLRLWGCFIRLRDANRCVVCQDDEGIAAHHVLRKSFLPQARFETGNGITLCRDCHAEPHAGFNGKPDMAQPMDMQGGDNLELIRSSLFHLCGDATLRGMLRDDYYFVSDGALRTYKNFQNLPHEASFPAGARIEQAYLIWCQTPRPMLDAIANALGYKRPRNLVQRPGVTIFNLTDSN
ncbi:MAG TPA: HNH endonuclease [Thermoanaerobaculia bacterium]